MATSLAANGVASVTRQKHCEHSRKQPISLQRIRQITNNSCRFDQYMSPSIFVYVCLLCHAGWKCADSFMVLTENSTPIRYSIIAADVSTGWAWAEPLLFQCFCLLGEESFWKTPFQVRAGPVNRAETRQGWEFYNTTLLRNDGSFLSGLQEGTRELKRITLHLQKWAADVG